MKPKQDDNTWLGNTVTHAQLQVINEETNRWQTVGTCIDTPNAIQTELAKDEYKGRAIWIRDVFGARRYHGLVKWKEQEA